MRYWRAPTSERNSNGSWRGSLDLGAGVAEIWVEDGFYSAMWARERSSEMYLDWLIDSPWEVLLNWNLKKILCITQVFDREDRAQSAIRALQSVIEPQEFLAYDIGWRESDQRRKTWIPDPVEHAEVCHIRPLVPVWGHTETLWVCKHKLAFQDPQGQVVAPYKLEYPRNHGEMQYQHPLVWLASEMSSNIKNKSNCGRFSNRAKHLLKVNSILLSEASSHLSSLEPINTTFRLLFNSIDPFANNNILMCRLFN